MFRVVCVALFASLVLANASAAQSTGSSEPDPRGPVLCVWMIYSILLSHGEACRQEDAAYLGKLRQGVGRIEDFIFRNSDATRQQLDDVKQSQMGPHVTECGPGGEVAAMYDAFKSDEADFDQELDILLEVDRPPVLNPCL